MMAQEMIEPIDRGVLLALHESEVNQQIATAKRFPRAAQRVPDDILAMVTESEEAAQECIYALKRDGQEIIGPTARFAEIVASCWGNSRYAARIIDEGEKFVTAQGVFHDLERNIYLSIEVKRRITTREGRRYGDDMIQTTSGAAVSIALRNAILKGVPKTAWGPGYAKALAMIAGTFESIEKRRTAALEAFKRLGADQSMVLTLLEKGAVKDIEPHDLLVLRGTLNAIKDGDTTMNAVFGAAQRASAASTANNGGKADVAGKLKEGQERHANGEQSRRGQGTAKPAAAEQTGAPATDAGQGAEGQRALDSDAGNDNAGAEHGDDAAQEGAGGDRGNGSGADGDTRDKPQARAAGGEGDQADAAADDEDEKPQARWAPFLDDLELTDEEVGKLGKLAAALDKAESSVQVTKISGEFLPVFESASPHVEATFTKMVAFATKELRSKRGAGKL
jgi:hypothetical protein